MARALELWRQNFQTENLDAPKIVPASEAEGEITLQQTAKLFFQYVKKLFSGYF
jgi:hypothetical protein